MFCSFEIREPKSIRVAQLPTTLLTGHSFIYCLDLYIHRPLFGNKTASEALEVEQHTKVVLRGFSGTTTHEFLDRHMRTPLPKSEVVILDIGCNDFDKPAKQKRTPEQAAQNVFKMAETFTNTFGAKYVIAIKATPRIPPARMKRVPMETYNKNVEDFNDLLDKFFSNLPRAETHTHSEVLALNEKHMKWTSDGLHPAGPGMKAYMKSMKRAIVRGIEMAAKVEL